MPRGPGTTKALDSPDTAQLAFCSTKFRRIASAAAPKWCLRRFRLCSLLVYVPVYSHIYHQRGRPQLLTVTLSVRNTDLEREILLTSVRYYDTSGQEVKSHLDRPLRISALAAIEFVVARDDTTGGSGANFIVERISSKPVSAPVIETVMIDTSGNQGISFVRQGTVIEEKLPDQPVVAPVDE